MTSANRAKTVFSVPGMHRPEIFFGPFGMGQKGTESWTRTQYPKKTGRV